ncbi:MAG: hypothetical protein SF069_05985 [Phycisphaerae bacterium]|nr:hypothetical protein [Phycisphaerae bacterium]
MAKRRRNARRRAISLLEVLISVTLAALLFTMYFAFTEQAMKSRDAAAARAEQTQIARQVLDRLSMELRGTLGMEQIGFPVQARLIGDRRTIKFLTTALPTPEQYRIYRQSEDLPPGHHDIREIEYKLWVDSEKTTEAGDPVIGGIIRTEKQTLNQFLVDEEEPEQLRQDLWSHELCYLEFRYYDGAQWSTVWDVTEGNSLPQLIMITVGFKAATQADLDDSDLETFPVDEYPFGDPMPHADRYSQIVRVQAADRFFSSRFQRVGKQLSSQLGVEGVKQ